MAALLLNSVAEADSSEATPHLRVVAGAGYLVTSGPNQLFESGVFGYARIGAEWKLRSPALRLGATVGVTSVNEVDIEGGQASAYVLDTQLDAHLGFDPHPAVTTRLHVGMFSCEMCISLAQDPRLAVRLELAMRGVSAFVEGRLIVFDFAQPAQLYKPEKTFSIGFGAESPSPAKPTQGRYPHAILVADAAAGLMALTSNGAPQLAASVGVYALTSPIVHLALRERRNAWMSAAVRLSALAGILIASKVNERCYEPYDCRMEFPVGVGTLIALAASAVDAAVFAQH